MVRCPSRCCRAGAHSLVWGRLEGTLSTIPHGKEIQTAWLVCQQSLLCCPWTHLEAPGYKQHRKISGLWTVGSRDWKDAQKQLALSKQLVGSCLYLLWVCLFLLVSLPPFLFSFFLPSFFPPSLPSSIPLKQACVRACVRVKYMYGYAQAR